ncbi:Ras-related protein rsr1 [Balamuthia mandrillaris]
MKKRSREEDGGEERTECPGGAALLPAEVWFHVLSYLETAEDLCNVSLACCFFARLSRQDALWRPLGHPSWAERPEEEQEEAEKVSPEDKEEEYTQKKEEEEEEQGLWKQRYMGWLRKSAREWKTNPPLTPLPAFPDTRYDASINVVIFGNKAGIGKTCLFLRMAGQGYDPHHHHNTIGADIRVRIREAQGQRIALKMWDSIGSGMLPQSLSAYLSRNVHAFVVCYDTTDKESLTGLERALGWVRQDCSPSKGVRFLVGTKCDLLEENQVDEETALRAAKEWAAWAHIRTSAKTGENVETLVETLLGTAMCPFGARSHVRPNHVPSPAALQRRGIRLLHNTTNNKRGKTKRKKKGDLSQRCLLQ